MTSRRPQLWLIPWATNSSYTGSGTAPATITTTAASTTGPGGGDVGSLSMHLSEVLHEFDAIHKYSNSVATLFSTY